MRRYLIDCDEARETFVVGVERGEEQWFVVYLHGRERQARRVLWRWASRGELAFSGADASALSRAIGRLHRAHAAPGRDLGGEAGGA